jgi:hypothetical protein
VVRWAVGGEGVLAFGVCLGDTNGACWGISMAFSGLLAWELIGLS